MSKHKSTLASMHRRLARAEKRPPNDPEPMPPEVIQAVKQRFDHMTDEDWLQLGEHSCVDPATLPDTAPRWNGDDDPLGDHNKLSTRFYLWYSLFDDPRFGHPDNVPAWDGNGDKANHYWQYFVAENQRRFDRVEALRARIAAENDPNSMVKIV